MFHSVCVSHSCPTPCVSHFMCFTPCVCPTPCVSLSVCVSHSVKVFLSKYVSHPMYVSDSMYVSHFVCISLHVYPTLCISHYVHIQLCVYLIPCPTSCIVHPTPWASHFVCIPLCICSTSWVFNSVILYPLLYPLLNPTPISHSYIPPRVSHSVFHSLNIPLCVRLIISLRMHSYASQFVWTFCLYTPLFMCFTPCVIHSVCFTPCVPSSLYAAPKVWAKNSTIQSNYPSMYCGESLIW